MSWLKIDDGIHTHAKVAAAGNAAMGLWLKCGGWCAEKGSDGFVPFAIAKVYGIPREARALVNAGLWIPVEGGYQMHDWLDYNPSAAEVEETRRTRAEAGSLGGRKSAQRRSERVANGPANSQASATADAQANPEQIPTPSPSPSPYPVSQSVVVSKPVPAQVPTDDDDDFVAKIINEVADLRCNGKALDNRAKYRSSIVANFRHEELDQLQAFIAQHPEARDEGMIPAVARVYEATRTDRAG